MTLADGRMIFAVSRCDESDPFLLIGALNADDAIARVLEQERIGTFFEHGYYESGEIGTRYIASPATIEQTIEWLEAIRKERTEGYDLLKYEDMGLFIWLREPEFPRLDDDLDAETAKRIPPPQ